MTMDNGRRGDPILQKGKRKHDRSSAKQSAVSESAAQARAMQDEDGSVLIFAFAASTYDTYDISNIYSSRGVGVFRAVCLCGRWTDDGQWTGVEKRARTIFPNVPRTTKNYQE